MREITIKRKSLCDFINNIDKIIEEVDKMITERDSAIQGHKLAELMNKINYQTQLAKRFMLGMKIDDLSKKAK